MQTVRVEDGPSLSLASYLRGTEKLQSLSTFLWLYNIVLLGMFWRSRNMVLERDYGACPQRDRRRDERSFFCKCDYTGCIIGHLGVGFGWIYGMALFFGSEGPDDH